jgi:tRNA A-37 threonylcarbamoyl transferase component Bud32/ligand-binding sensor domain-containing protein
VRTVLQCILGLFVAVIVKCNMRSRLRMPELAFCFCWLLLATTTLIGQRYPILPVPNSPHGIFTMIQDSNSRIWMGTIDDVICFDGVNFYSLRQYGFPKEVPNAFAEDSDGGLWIATQGTNVWGGTGQGGLYRYQAGQVEKLFSGNGLSVVSVAAGTMLASFGTEVEGRPVYGDLYRFRKSQGTWTAERLSEKAANHLTVDRQGTALFPCPGGWCEMPRQQIVEWQGPSTKLTLQEHAGNPLVERVLRDRFDCLWFRAEAAASYQCPGMSTIASVPDTISKYDSSAHLEEAPDGSVFMLVSLALGRPGAFHSAGIVNGIPADLETALVATDGTIWLGAQSGLYRFMYPFRLEYWNQDNGIETPYSILRINDKVFTTSSGVAILNKDRRNWTTLPGTEQFNGVSKLITGPMGTIVAASRTGVTQLRVDGTIVARSEFSAGGTTLASNKDGQVWLGRSLGKKGISRVTKRGDRLILNPENLPENENRDLRYDEARDTLWACNGKELAFRTSEGWRHITNKDGLLGFDCRSIAVHPNGNVWLGYNNSPYSLIKNPMSNHAIIKNYANDMDKLVANRGNEFLDVDRRGWIWRGSNVDYVANSEAAEAGDWLRLDEQDGIPAPGGNEHAFFSDPDGSIWFGSNATITHFSPAEDFATYFPPPSLFISGFSVGKSSPALAETITTVPHSKDIVAHIGSLQFDRRNALNLRYRLLPEQTAWQLERDFDIHFDKLSWGSHTLEVQGQLSTGPWSTTASKSFTVLRPIWLSWPALLGFALTAGIGATGAFRVQKKRKERKSKTLPALAEWRLAALSPEFWQLDGTVLDSRFEVGRVLARGGFATVAEGRDLEQGSRPCAVKIFRQELTDNNWMTRRFQQEVLALEKIYHPNVVRIYGHGTTPSGSPYLVMEFVNGQTLRERLEEGDLTPQQTASYLRQIGSALDEIHAHGICHRDLKPENLMLRKTSPAGQELVLIDFSIAIVRDPDETLHGLSRAAGTIYYMAPEQSIGYADSSTDIYSLAKIVIEMLTGQRLSVLLPDASMDLPDRVRELLSGLRLGLSSHSIELMSSALEFDPSRRPKVANEFANQIAQDLESVPETI